MDEIGASYDAVAERYADEIGGELPGKPVDRALYGLFAELVRADLDAATAIGAAAPRAGDVGCGPGHVTNFLAELGLDVVGIDLSPRMIEVATSRYPSNVGSATFRSATFRTGDMTAPGGLGEADGAWAGAVCPYSIVHFGPVQRALAFAELARVIRDRGWLLIAFHISDASHALGGHKHVDEWWGHDVDLDFEFIDPADVTAELASAGFAVRSRTDREPWPGVEAPSRRSYLLAQRFTS